LGTLGLIALSVLVLRLFTLQVVFGPKYREYAEKNWLRPKRVPGHRGGIVDRNGTVLADIVPSFSVMFDAQHEAFGKHPDLKKEVLDRVARLTGNDASEFEEIVERTKAYSYEPITLLRSVDMRTVITLEERRHDLPGVFVDTVPMRYYPQDSLAAHVLGYVQEVTDQDLADHPDIYRLGSMIGRTGIEASFEPELRGRDGVEFIEVSAVGRRSEHFLSLDPIPPTSGQDLRLALDADLQRTAEEALEAAPYNGPGKAPPEVKGAVVLLDVRNGDVLAMASRPTYNPNAFSKRLSPEVWGHMNRDTQPLFHRAIKGRYPPGSTFKPLTLYGALEEDLVEPQERLAPCRGGWQYGNRFFRCWNAAGHGALTAEEALAHSCDTYFYQLAPRVGLDGFQKFTRRFGMDEKTGIHLLGEAVGLVPSKAWFNETYGPRGWSRGVTLNLAIGQGELAFTPIELAVFTASIATGRRVTPRLVLEQDGRPMPVLPQQDLHLEARCVDVVRRGMEQAVLKGTAQVVRFPNLRVAAKTGTAENAGVDNAVFVAYAPVEDPQVALVVYLENRGHGGAAAGPVARRLLAAYFDLGDVGNGILPEGD